MSWSIHLFIDAPVSLDVLSGELGKLLHVPFEKVEEGDETYYEHDDRRYSHMVFRVNSGLENDLDKNFEDYAYELKIRARRVSDWETAQKACLELGRVGFEELKKIGRYKLMLTHQLGTKLDSFSPAAIAR